MGFDLPLATEHLTLLARSSVGGEDALRLLAHAWATAQAMCENCGALRGASALPVADALSRVRDQGFPSDEWACWSTLLALLTELDERVGPRLAGAPGGVISVGSLRAPRVGAVRWWPRVDGPDRLRDRFHQLRLQKWDYASALPLRNLSFTVLDGGLPLTSHRLGPAPGRRWALVDATLERFRIALFPLEGDYFPLFRVTTPPPALGPDTPAFRGMEALYVDLEKALAACASERITLAVFPELMVPTPARDWLIQRLRGEGAEHPLAVVAGSRWVEEEGRRYNEATWIDRTGRTIGVHRKRGLFGMRVSDLQELGTPGTPPGPHADERVNESITLGETLSVLETAVGRIGVLICADLLDSSAGYRTLLHASAHLDVLVVVSLTMNSVEFHTVAAELHRVGTTTVFVNAGHLVVRGGQIPLDRAFVSSPFQKAGVGRWTEAPCSLMSPLGASGGVVLDLGAVCTIVK